MTLGLCLLTIAALLASLALSAHAPPWQQGLGLYVALSALVVALGYLGLGPRVFGKRADGRLSAPSLVLLAPFHLLVALSLRLSALSREGAFHEVAPGLLLGRRAFARDLAGLRAAGVQSVLDVTSELSEAPALRRLTYRNIPVLDTLAPTPAQLKDGVTWLAARRADGPVIVHCAVGHGRSATFAAAYLLATGMAASPGDAEARLRAVRPGVALNAMQRAALAAFVSAR